MTTRLEILLLSALCLLIAATVGSCAQNELDVPAEPEPAASGRGITLKFKILADNIDSQTRSGLGQWEEESANNTERILNPRDMRVLILNADGNLIQSVKPAGLSYTPGTPEVDGGIAGDGYYDLTVFFQEESFDKYFKDNGKDANISFSVLILANMNSVGSLYTTDAMSRGTLNAKLQETFTMTSDWFPSEINGIPMFGYTYRITANQKQLTQIGGLDVTSLIGPVNMLRAVCKLEVRDILKGRVASDGKKYPHVSGIELISWRSQGYLRPASLGYEYGLTSAYIPSTSPLVTDNPLQGRFMDDNGDGEGVYRLYCPEAKLNDVTVRVHVQTAPGAEEKTYDVNLGQYADGYMGDYRIYGDDMVRNHIYRFEVNSIGAQADLTLTVLPWTKQTDEYTLDDILEMEADGFLTWTYNAEDFSVSDVIYNGKREKQLSMFNSTTDYVTGRFHIKSPTGAIWRAYLIPGENGVDAFEFVDTDGLGNVIAGSEKSYVEGAVGAPAEFHLRGKGPADAYRHTAELVIEVRQPDGTIIFAPMSADDKASTRYIIYRENKL